MIARGLSLLPVAALCVSPASPACPTPPLFDLTGPVCPPERLDVECGCSEGMRWDPAEGAGWYEVERAQPGSGNWFPVGNTELRNRPAHCEAGAEDNAQTPSECIAAGGTWMAEEVITYWFFAWDLDFPQQAGSYDYRVRAMKADPNGGPPIPSQNWTERDPNGEPLRYRAAPYMCIENGAELPCYPGDPLIR